MNKKEFATFAMALKTYFPKENLLPNSVAMDLWYMELQDLEYNVAQMALRKYVHINKFSPTIAELREIAAEITTEKVEDWGEGWKELQHAIRKFGIYRTQEALESLNGVTKDVVKRLGFKELCMSENPVADRARFKDIYEQLAKRKKVESQMPANLLIEISKVTKKMELESKSTDLEMLE